MYFPNLRLRDPSVEPESIETRETRFTGTGEKGDVDAHMHTVVTKGTHLTVDRLVCRLSVGGILETCPKRSTRGASALRGRLA